MKTRTDIAAILRRALPDLEREFGVRRRTIFGPFARGDADENSDVNVLVDVRPTIGLRFVELAD